MFSNKLTINQVESCKNKRIDGKSDRFSDGSGLWLNVTEKQTKQFRFDYTRPNTRSENLPHGKRNTISIGTYPSISLIEARRMRDQYKLLLAEGVDPSEWKESKKRIKILEKSSDLSFNEVVVSINVKVIIIAAGLGSRLNKYTEALPKCMLKFGNKTLLEIQLNIHRELGINDISVVRGYKKEKINYEGINYYENTDYQNNNILNSLYVS
jgi:hypothetical protein